MFDVIKLALETDSSRLVSLFIDTTVIHNITHHGNRPEVLAELRAKEEGQFDVLAGVPEVAGRDARRRARRCSTGRWCCTAPAWAAPTRTRTPTCRCCWPAAGSSTASTSPSTRQNNYPLTNLFVSMLQRLGIEASEFSTGKGTIRGLEMA